MEEAPDFGPSGQRAPKVARRRRRLLLVAAGLGVAGAVVVVVSLAALSGPGSDAAPTESPTEDRAGDSVPFDGAQPSVGDGVSPDPRKTGLPVKSPEGSKVRTGTKEEGCFSDMRAYLDEYHESGVEPDPCFTGQPPSGQDQPDGVVRSYNGERF